MSGPASHTTSPAGSVLATQPPLDVLAKEPFDQLRPMHVCEAVNRLLEYLVPAIKSSLLD